MPFLKRAMSFVLTFALCFEALLPSGIAAAAEPAPDDAGQQQNAETLDATIDAFWAAVDEEGDTIYDANDERVWTQDASQYKTFSAPTTVRVIRNGSEQAEFELTGAPDETMHKATIGQDTFEWQETSPWHVQLAGLPKYDENGIAYSYLFLDKAIDGFAAAKTERGANADDSTLYARFYKFKSANNSAYSTVPISVRWADGGDASSRMPINVGLYANRDISVDGRTIYYKDALIASRVLSEDNSWYSEIIVPASGIDVADSDCAVRAVELSTFDDGLETQGLCTVLSRDEVISNSDHYASLLRNWSETDSDLRMVSADSSQGFAYKVTCARNSVIGSLEITNQRVGSNEASIERAWLDEGAEKTARPQSSFTLVSPTGDIEFVYDAGANIYARVPGQNDYALYKKDAADQLVPLLQGVDVTVSPSCDSFTFTVDSTEDSFAYSVVNLPKYDAHGAAIDWRVNQNWTGEHGDYQITASEPQEAFTSPWHQEDVQAFSFANRREGVKSVTYHVKWFDHYVKDELNQRPDTSFSLYRLVHEYDANGVIIGSTDLEAVPAGEYDSRLELAASATADRMTNDATGDFTQYVTFANLPKYDAQGKAYVYYASANLDEVQSAQGALDYYYSGVVSHDDYAVDPGSWTAAVAEVVAAPEEVVAAAEEETSDSAASVAASDSSKAYREGTTFNYRIQGSVTISGEKQWGNLPEGFSSDDLPDVSVYVQRRLQQGSYDSAGVWTETVTPWSRLSVAADASSSKGYAVKSSATGMVVGVPGATEVAGSAEATGAADATGVAGACEVSDGQTAVAWTNLFKKDGMNWSFSISCLGDNADETQASATSAASALPAFDAEGRCFEYRVREVIDGMMGSSVLDRETFFGVSSTDAVETAFGKVYEISYSGYSITNAFKYMKSSLTLHEVFANSAAGSKYPSSTFRLYRYYDGATGKSALEYVDQKVLAASAAATGLLTFDGLDVYAPTGEKWHYIVVEIAPDGYDATSVAGDLTASDSGFKGSDEWAAANGVALSDDATNSWSMGPAVELSEGASSVLVTFKNMRSPGNRTLCGTMHWVDQGNVFGTRTFSISFKVTRTYQDGTPGGEVELQTADAAAANYLAWTSQPFDGSTNLTNDLSPCQVSESDTWTYELRNLEKWAPDGQAWKYAVEEYPLAQYKVKPGTENGGACDEATGQIPAITNELKGQVGFKKSWIGDSNDSWLQRPSSYFTLQAREAGTESAWSEAGMFFASLGVNLQKSTTYDSLGFASYVLTGSDGSAQETVVGFTDDAQDAVTYDSSATWCDLPLLVTTSEAVTVGVEYRVVESLLIYEKNGAAIKVYLDCDKDGNYSAQGVDAYSSYMPTSLTEVTKDNAAGSADVAYAWKSDIVNVYEGGTTSIKARYTWDDGDNAQVTRPGTSSADEPGKMTFALQRSVDGGQTWQWFTGYGAIVSDPFIGLGLNENIFTRVVSNGETEITVDGLPAKGVRADGREVAYRYRLVALVAGSYQVATNSDDVLAASQDGSMRLEVMPADDEGVQEYIIRLVNPDAPSIDDPSDPSPTGPAADEPGNSDGTSGSSPSSTKQANIPATGDHALSFCLLLAPFCIAAFAAFARAKRKI